MVAFLVVIAIGSAACGEPDPGEAGAAEDAPPKVTVAGDSISLGLGVAVREVAEGDPGGGEVVVRAIGEDGTGLARPDNFDWPERLGELAEDFPPEVLVLSVGSNDAQDLTDRNGATVVTMSDPEAWDEEYSARLAAVFDEFSDTDTTVVWLGQVRAEDQGVAEVNRHVHELASGLAASRDWVRVEDLAELTGSGANSTSECLSADGLHLSATCYERAAAALLERLELG